jgi:hypothetical protein
MARGRFVVALMPLGMVCHGLVVHVGGLAVMVVGHLVTVPGDEAGQSRSTVT